jgi:arginase
MGSDARIAVLGIASDENASFLRGAAGGPRAIREALASGSANRFSETGTELTAGERYLDRGDLDLPPWPAALERIESAVARELDAGRRVLSLGGDHAVTYPILRAYGRRFPDLTLLHLDAHSDLYDQYAGNRFSHACPFARIMEAALVKRLLQVGIRTLNDHQRAQIRRFGVEVLEMRTFRADTDLNLTGPVYLSLDLDVLDPGFAPGVSHHEPGGLDTRTVIDLIQRIPGPLVGADIVELNPQRDVNGMTAMVAAKLFKEIAARMLTTPAAC